MSEIYPSLENEEIYGPSSDNDPEVLRLAQTIKEHGIKDPLWITEDGYIISGHRRRVAAMLAGLKEVPVKVDSISRTLNPEELKRRLVALNSQRHKSVSVQLRETLATLDPKNAHQQIVNQRLEKDMQRWGSDLSAIDPEDIGRRDKISAAKMPMLARALTLMEGRKEFWPLTVRQVHYLLLGPNAPLGHAGKPGSTYVNDKSCYKDLCDLLGRARIEGYVPWAALDDETRRTDLNEFYRNPKDFFDRQFKNFLRYYWRNRQQSQPNHIEILGEKLTVHPMLQRIASEYTIPLTITRGTNVLAPKYKIYQRFKASRKAKLILLIVGYLDPMGDTIAEDPIKSFQRDFGLPYHQIEAYRVALTPEQVDEFGLAPSMKAKPSSATYDKLVAKYNSTDAYELEAMDPADLSQMLEDAIKKVMDIDLYNQELAAEEKDSTKVIGLRMQIDEFLKTVKF